jgi:DnaJ-class molecular chaperone
MFGKTDKPEEQITEPVVEEAPHTATAEEEQAALEKIHQQFAEFNCVPCGGKGLIGDPTDVHSKPCAACKGTGKV